MKKILKALFLSMMAFTLVACSSGDDSAEGGTSEGGETYEVGVAIYQYNDNFMTEYRKELESYFGELSEETGNEYVVDMQDGKNDQANQTEQINNFIAQGKDVIIANLVDPTAANNIINQAKEVDIPVVLINREPNPSDLEVWPGKTTYVGADATQSGTFQGEMIAALDDNGDINDDGVVSHITLLGDPGNVDAQQRTEYSIKALEESGIDHEALQEPQQGDWDAARGEEITQSALEQFGEDLEVVFSNNDGMALGAVQAIQSAEREINEDIYVVGVDAIPDAMQLLKDGELTGTVLNNHLSQSHTAADVAVKLMNGEDVSAYYWLDYVKVTEAEDAELKEVDATEETVEEVRERYEDR
ncbi:MAG: substrate-binding domain-containing protein [Atopostipes suicloacalis]|nr:substrate-binding domain-containing protein [Atopostipes suicloacalis]MDN6730855.1 substrate-binding domain-containing protein [Atopostipes suicloacalis]